MDDGRKSENISDLVNNPEYITVGEGEDIPDTPVSEETDSAIDAILEHQDLSEIGIQTMISLGARLKIGSVELRPPSMGVVSLLDSLGSPFVTSGEEKQEITVHQILEAVYVMSLGVEAVQHVYEAIRMERELEKTVKIAEKSPEFYDVFLRYLSGFSRRKAEIDIEVERFAEKIGIFEPETAIRQIFEYLSVCMSGFDMIPADQKNGDPDKKKDVRLMQTG
jgi:hypothetical protein